LPSSARARSGCLPCWPPGVCLRSGSPRCRVTPIARRWPRSSAPPTSSASAAMRPA
jgi:hypothetical protein